MAGGLRLVFSPSTTSDWLKCPLYNHLRHEGWKPRRLGKVDLAGLLGTAFAKGVAVYNATRKEGLEPDITACVHQARVFTQSELIAWDEQGFQTPDWEVAYRQALPGRVEKALTKYAAEDPLPKQWKIRDVELALPRWGNCRIDLGLETDLGPAVLDYKTKVTLDSRYLPKTIRSYQHSEQRYHYTAAYEDHLGTPVHTFYICMLVLEPWKVHLLPFTTNPEEQEMWFRSRQTTWHLMDKEKKGELAYQMAAVHEDNFGPCIYQTACMDYHLDPNLMTQDYLKRGRRD